MHQSSELRSGFSVNKYSPVVFNFSISRSSRLCRSHDLLSPVIMFEATLVEARFLKKVFDVIKDLVLDANIYCSATGLSLKASYCHRLLQANSDMPLKDTHSDPYFVGLLLGSERFQHYKCDKDISRSIDIGRMAKILECAEDDDIITLKADDVNNTFTLVFESRSKI